MDQIWIWNTAVNTWYKYGYHRIAANNIKWQRCDTNTATWYDLTESDVLAPGQSFLFYNGSTSSINVTMAGQITDLSESPYFDIPNKKYMYVAYPWPEAKTIAQVGASYAEGYSPKSSSSFGAAMDQIWLWNTTANTWYKYGYHRISSTNIKWQRCDTNTATWYDLDDATDVVPAGYGFLFYNGATSPTRLQFTR